MVGYEPNGGYLLGFEAKGPAGAIAPLWTRDCFLPLIVTLSRARGRPLSRLVAEEPGGVTRASLLRPAPLEASTRLVHRLRDDAEARRNFLEQFGGTLSAMNLTDGVRMTLVGGNVVHVRPSGNAPELRLYVEAGNAARAEKMLQAGLAALRSALERSDSDLE